MNWPLLMRLGLGVLRLPPNSFWSMTPRELSAALNPNASAPSPMSLAELNALAARYPDRAEQSDG